MEQHSNVVRLCQPNAIDDPLTEVLRGGARYFRARAVKLEVEAFLAERAGLVRHGHAPERAVQTGADRDRRRRGGPAQGAGLRGRRGL